MQLSDWLKKNDLKPEVFAGRIGVSYSTVTRYLRGTRKPDWTVLQVIKKETKGAVTPDDFLDADSGDAA